MTSRLASRARQGAALACAALLYAAALRAARADVGSENAAAAEALFREARALLTQGRAAEACPKLAASQKLDPGYGTLFNLAECQEQIGKTASAWAAFREAADMARKASQADREKKATRRAEALEPKLERVTVTPKAPAPGLSIRRDLVLLDAATWGVALPVDPGTHALEATAPGRKPWKLEVATKGPGQTVAVEVPPLEPAPPSAPEAGVAAAPPAEPGPSAAAEPRSGGRTQRIAGFVSLGVGAVGIGLGTAFGLMAGSQWDDAQTNHCRTDTLCDPTGVELAGDAKTSATVSTIAFVAGGVAAAAGVVLIVTAPRGEEPPKQGRARVHPRLAVAPAAGAGFGGLCASGAF